MRRDKTNGSWQSGDIIIYRDHGMFGNPNFPTINI